MSPDDRDRATDPRLPRPGEAGWSSTGWPDSAGRLRPDRAAPPTPPAWPDDNRRPGEDDTTTRFELPLSDLDPTATGPPPLPPPAPGTVPPTGGGGAEPRSADDSSLRDRLGSIAERVTGAARVERLDDSFSLRHLFGNSLSRRSQTDIERELMVGTSSTTPPLASVRAEWPQPWLFARTLLATSAVFGLFLVGWTVFGAITLLPGLIIVGSFAMPTAVLIFFFEINVARNVSIVDVLRMVFLGGAASLVFSLIGFSLVDAPWLGATVAGIVEEPAKLLAVVLVARQPRHRFILNGALFGAAIGAGFAAFESAGYAMVAALFALDNTEVIDSIILRGVLSPLGHVAWTAMAAAALWRVRDGAPLRLEHVRDPRFWRIMVLAVVLHTAWNSPIPDVLYLKHLLLGGLAWLVCLALLQEGIGQIRRAQEPSGARPDGH